MKKQDLFLLGGILLLAIIFFSVYLFLPRENGAFAAITIQGKTTKMLPLNKDTTYTIKTKNHSNTLQIKDGFASIIKADCPDKLCVHQRKISKKGETLVCLPHKVIISIADEKNEESDSSFDGIAK